MGYEVKLPGKQTLKARIVGIYGNTADSGIVFLHSGNYEDYAAPTGYGLGDVYGKMCDNCLDPELKIGFYYLHSGTINSPALIANSQFGTMQVERRGDRKWHTVKFRGYVACCHLHDGVWSEWEYENPPMTVGVEYRTTERYKGKAVYKKVDENGNILWRGENETAWHLLSSADYVATATVE